MLTPRLQTYGYWGRPRTPALSVNLTAESTWKAAIAKGKVKGLRVYRKGRDADGVTQPAIGLNYRVNYASGYNTTSSWSSNAGVHFETIPNAFDSGAPGLLYSNDAPNAAAKFTSLWKLNANGSVSFRFHLFAPHPDQARQIVAIALHRWRVEIVDGSISILRTSAKWTEAKQQQLDTLLNVEGQPSDANQATIAALRLEIYEAGYDQGVKVQQQKTNYGDWFEFTLIPEPRGILNVITNDAEEAVEIPEILETRAPGVVWASVPVVITTNGGAMFWQNGKVEFSTLGELLTEKINWRYGQMLSDLPIGEGQMLFNGQFDESAPGTDVGLSLLQPSETGDTYRIRAVFTGNGTYTPFLYSAEGFVAASARTGSTDESWDSNGVSDFDTNGEPIKELSPEYDKEMWRRSCVVTMRNIEGRLNLPGTLQQGLHDRMCDVTIGGDPFITGGIVRASQFSEMKSAAANQAPHIVTHRWSEFVAEVADQWAVMDADTMTDNPKGDGLRLGAYLRLVLRGAGVKDSEMTGIDPSAGRSLPRAAPGEGFLIQPDAECGRGDWLRRMVTDWGMGMVLYISKAGVWTLTEPDTTVRASFSSSATSGYRILGPLDIVRDFCDSYNFFTIEGAEINGRRKRQIWRVAQATDNPDWAGFTGRRRAYPTITADYCRTDADLQWVLRSNVRNFAKPGRWFRFPSNFHRDIDIGMCVEADGVKTEIVSIGGSSIQFGNDRMELTAREIISVGA